jgi:hypothetical protein
MVRYLGLGTCKQYLDISAHILGSGHSKESPYRRLLYARSPLLRDVGCQKWPCR